MPERQRNQWEKLGERDPYWAVLSDPAMKDGKWDRNAFFASGEQEIDAVLSTLTGLGISLAQSLALDFGCGVGRLSRALARDFDSVVALDISSSMLAEARSANADFSNIEFLQNTAPDLAIIASDSVDFIYSNIVLQHLPADNQLTYIAEFCRVLRPGGVLVFQTPASVDLSTLTGWAHLLLPTRAQNLLRSFLHGSDGVMEIHTLPKATVRGLLEKQGMRVAEIGHSSATGPGFRACIYYCVRE